MWRSLLLVFVSNRKEDQSAVVLVVHEALDAVSAVHCKEGNEINNNRKETEVDIQESFFPVISSINTNLFVRNWK
jgi:hypothetical protein